MAKKIPSVFQKDCRICKCPFQRKILSDTLGGIKTRKHCRGISETIFMKPSGAKNEY